MLNGRKSCSVFFLSKRWFSTKTKKTEILPFILALDHKEIRMMCRKKLAEIGVETGRCPHGYEQFDCACYKVIDHEMAPFEDAQKFCKKEGGSLAMPKTEQHQVKT